MSNEPTTTDILHAISDIASHMDEQFVLVRQEFKQEMKQEISQSEHRVKSYIDDKLADSTSDIFHRLDRKYEKEK